MPVNRNDDRANLGEQTDLDSTDVERQDRSMSTGSRVDTAAGSEGIEDPAMERSSRDAMHSASSEQSGRASSRDMSRARKRARKGRESRLESRERSSEQSESEDPMS